MPFHFNSWFALACSHEVPANAVLGGMLGGKKYELSRTKDGTLRLDGRSDGIREQNGFILTWKHKTQVLPTWFVPVLDETGWSHLSHHRLLVHTHPQEVFENSVDFAHFSVVHGFRNIRILQAPLFDAHTMRTRYEIKRHFLRPRFEVYLHGLGSAHNHIEVPGLGLSVRMFVWTTPLEENTTQIWLAISVKNHPLRALIQKKLLQSIVHDFSQDIAIWENKQYYAKPLLVKGDGPVMDFRHWCQQFYSKEV